MPKSISIRICLLVFLLISIISCKKNPSSEPTPIDPEIPTPVNELELTEVDISNVAQNQFSIAFNLKEPSNNECGIFFSDDADKLKTPKESFDVQKGELNKSGNTYSMDVEVLKWNWAKISRVYYRVYLRDDNNDLKWSKIQSQSLATYELFSKVIVKGSGKINNSLIVQCLSADQYQHHWQSKINGVPLTVSSFVYQPGQTPYVIITYDVPSDLNFGNATYELLNQNNKVYSTDVSIVGGGMVGIYTHPVRTLSDIHFTFNNELYMFNETEDATFDLYKWIPGSENFNKIAIGDIFKYAFTIRLNKGQQIGDKIYFPPYVEQTESENPEENIYEENMLSLDPITMKWTITPLYTTNDLAKFRGWASNSCFVLNNKLYSVGMINEDFYTKISRPLMVYDPTDKSWKEVMKIPINDANTFATTVLNGKVYLLATRVKSNSQATNYFKNEFYEIDLQGKALIRKEWIADESVQGTYKPYLFGYHGKVYVYGGLTSLGYNTSASDLFAVYDLQKNSWKPVVGENYYGAVASQSSGFQEIINDKVYIGLGIDGNLFNLSDYKYQIHEVSLP
ncbi:MAG: hypothetical protein EOP46_00265 [Sphingobacteriaceae bacterium]|nr:MAG: hypothetical protein EOP46_00265 [Sphingobacteriaceae bacterium]